MVKQKDDPGLDDLLALDGIVLVVDPLGKHRVRFVVKRVAPSNERPHGVNYSLTLHAADGERLVGFDNAHTVKIGSGPSQRTITGAGMAWLNRINTRTRQRWCGTFGAMSMPY
jgi:hypothetical protein